mmetsp:Transcript_1214/g.4177  ORF Transcript_1214/g.4177 Transcript_1214/m.4177 type:complete len:128 (+) Transcript_1214:3-386(+)
MTADEALSEELCSLKSPEEKYRWIREHDNFESPHVVLEMLGLIYYLGSERQVEGIKILKRATNMCKRNGWLYCVQMGSNCLLHWDDIHRNEASKRELEDCFTKIYGFPESVDLIRRNIQRRQMHISQ